MRNRLLAFAIAAFVTVCVSCQPNKAPNPDQEPTKQINSKVISTNGQNNYNSANAHDAEAGADAPKWYAPLKRPEWWLVILGFGSLGVVCWQNAILRKSVAVAQKSAETTSQQVALYVNAERARMAIEIVDHGKLSLRIRGKNIGKTAAQIIYIMGRTIVLPSKQKLPEPPGYLSFRSPYIDSIETVAPGEYIDIFPFEGDGDSLIVDLSSDDLRSAIQRKESVLWAYGRICYRDGIMQETREKRFCYEAVVYEDGSINLDMSGPSAYRLET